MSSYSIPTMLKAGVHFGHQTRYWNPKIATYLYGTRNNIHIFDLSITHELLTVALQFVRQVVVRKGKILFVGTKYAARDIIQEEASRCGMPYVHYRWLGGLLTNYKTIRQSIKRLKELETMLAIGRFGRLTKKEVLNLQRKRDKLNNYLGGIKAMGGIPDALFIIDVGREKIAVKEANRLGVSIIGVVDSNNDPDGIQYPISGNDDSSRAIRFYAALLADTILAARVETESHESTVDVTHYPVDSTQDATSASSPVGLDGEASQQERDSSSTTD